MYTCVYVCMRVNECVVCACVRARVCVCVCVRACMRACACVRACARAFVCASVLSYLCVQAKGETIKNWCEEKSKKKDRKRTKKD